MQDDYGVVFNQSLPCRASGRLGFTLIELSMVLVIIGLIVGGVLVGQDLIKSAQIRSAIAQIDKYNAAVKAFRLKYNALPGDMDAATASQLGFIPRGAYAGEGDGNGILEGVSADAAASNRGTLMNIGETAVFWVDLTQAKMIEGSFTAASSTASVATAWLVPPSTFLPESKIGNSNYVYVWSGGWKWYIDASDGLNYFGIIFADIGSFNSDSHTYWRPGMTVYQAYYIDTKIDDALPQHGTIVANYPYNATVLWAAGGGAYGNFGDDGDPTVNPTPYTSDNCYDNNNTWAEQSYSLTNGNIRNCTLSFRFQ